MPPKTLRVGCHDLSVVLTPLQKFIAVETTQPYFKKRLQQFDAAICKGLTIYPRRKDLLAAFEGLRTHVKVVILGQDPYHSEQQAHGLSFSVPEGVKAPPSLKNIIKCLQADLGEAFTYETHALQGWARQGVLLLNTILSVETGQPLSHQSWGWQQFTDSVLAWINAQERPVVVMLWGRCAQKKRSLFNAKKHLILEAPHPSPLSAYRGFLNCQHFSKANRWLQAKGVETIDWSLRP